MGARFLIMGCGGIGGMIAAHLLDAGEDVIAVTTNRAIEDAVRAHGFRIRGVGVTPRAVRGRIVHEVPRGPFDFVLLATQPPQVEEAARSALPALDRAGAMVVLANGLCEARVAAIAGESRTLGAVVGWGGSMLEPGLYERTSRGGFAVGRMDGTPDARLDVLAHALAPMGRVEVTRNLAGKRWSKLAINCAISSLGTLGGARLGALLVHPFVRRLGLEVMTEVVEVARAEGVRLEKVVGTLDLAWLTLTPREHRRRTLSLWSKHAALLAVGLRFRRLRSSMLAAIERGRVPAVDFLNGEVVARAQRHGVDVPLNARIVERVWRVARGQDRPSLALLRALYDETRAPIRTAQSDRS